MTELRRLLSVVPPESPQILSSGNTPNFADLRSPSRELDDGHKAKKKRAKGWDGEADSSLAVAPLSFMDGKRDLVPINALLKSTIQIRL
jgi:hypothetical protein